MTKVLYSLLLSFSLIVFFSACKGSDETKEETTQEVSEKKPVAEQVEMIPMELNNGEKWKVDAQTTLGVNDLKTALEEVDVTARGEDYEILMTNLESAFKQAYESSELEGQAKEQFETFMKNVAQITDHLKSSDTFIRDVAVKELKKLLDSYSDYFE